MKKTKLEKLLESKKILENKIEAKKVEQFKKLNVPSLMVEHKKVPVILEHFNKTFGADFSYDENKKKVINLATINENKEYDLFKALQSFLSSKNVRSTIVEYDSTNKLSHLFENELEKAQVVLAAQDIITKLQDVAEDLVKIQTDSVMPLVDEIKMNFGTEVADNFSNITKETLDNAFETVRAAKDQIGTEVSKMNAVVNGEPYPSDIQSDTGKEDVDSDLDIDLDSDDIESDDVEPDLFSDEKDLGDEGLGRVKKESVEIFKKKIGESIREDDEFDGIPDRKRASIAGIKDNGLKWDNNLHLTASQYTSVMGDAIDNEDADSYIKNTIAFGKRLTNFINNLKNRKNPSEKIQDMLVDFERLEEEIERISDESELRYWLEDGFDTMVSEVSYIMNMIYDIFDYYRILVK